MGNVALTAPRTIAGFPTTPLCHKVGAKDPVHSPFDLSTLHALADPIPESTRRT